MVVVSPFRTSLPSMTEDTYVSVEPLPYMECVPAVKGTAALGGAPANLWALNSRPTGFSPPSKVGETGRFGSVPSSTSSRLMGW